MVETLFAVGITSIMFLGGMSAITFSKIQIARDKERGIISDFSVHYLETLRGLTFDNLIAGNPINTVFDGTGKDELGRAVAIRVPSNFNWISLNTSSYQVFCPDLVNMQQRNPEMRVNIDTTTVGGIAQMKAIRLEVRWDAPLGRGGKNSVRYDMVRTRAIERE
ncbi:MAG TPA: hypothetical protein DCM86_04690 [Verrucomicrobiales bacterium]|nr:hypothetical protein [Verrucomicrobiales bacterium]